mmetsp:Transcript_37565/g.107975  ORF Transcript_37565/g.107975 Transcript_37565/m.107975 type:complete len:235 (+) Transcript_37565:1117-1821(+)
MHQPIQLEEARTLRPTLEPTLLQLQAHQCLPRNIHLLQNHGDALLGVILRAATLHHHPRDAFHRNEIAMFAGHAEHHAQPSHLLVLGLPLNVLGRGRDGHRAFPETRPRCWRPCDVFNHPWQWGKVDLTMRQAGRRRRMRQTADARSAHRRLGVLKLREAGWQLRNCRRHARAPLHKGSEHVKLFLEPPILLLERYNYRVVHQPRLFLQCQPVLHRYLLHRRGKSLVRRHAGKP